MRRLWWSLALLACTEPVAPPAAAPTRDAGLALDVGVAVHEDAAVPPPPETASLTVLADGFPVVGQAVAFADEDGHLIALERTGSDGKIERRVTADSMITLVVPSAGDAPEHLATWAGVQPGDALVFDYPANTGAAPRVRFELPPLPMGARYATVDLGCLVSGRITSTAWEAEVPEGCAREGKLDALATVYGSRRSTLGYAFVTEATVGADPIRFGAWSGDAAEVEIAVDGLPFDARSLFVTVAARKNGASFGGATTFVPLESAVTAPSRRAMLRVPAGFSTEIAARATAEVPFLGGIGRAFVEVTDFGAPPGMTIGMEDRLPSLQRLFLDVTSPDRPSMGWSFDGDRGQEDVVQIDLEWGESQVERLWRFVADPRQPGRLRAPILPDDFMDLVPSATSGDHQVTISTFDHADFAGYAAFRAGHGPKSPRSSKLARRSYSAAAGL